MFSDLQAQITYKEAPDIKDMNTKFTFKDISSNVFAYACDMNTILINDGLRIPEYKRHSIYDIYCGCVDEQVEILTKKVVEDNYPIDFGEVHLPSEQVREGLVAFIHKFFNDSFDTKYEYSESKFNIALTFLIAYYARHSRTNCPSMWNWLQKLGMHEHFAYIIVSAMDKARYTEHGVGIRHDWLETDKLQWESRETTVQPGVIDITELAKSTFTDVLDLTMGNVEIVPDKEYEIIEDNGWIVKEGLKVQINNPDESSSHFIIKCSDPLHIKMRVKVIPQECREYLNWE